VHETYDLPDAKWTSFPTAFRMCRLPIPGDIKTSWAWAVFGLLENPARIERIGRRAYEASRPTIWPAVARRYLTGYQVHGGMLRAWRAITSGKSACASSAGCA
jgi:hypothetical protein